MPGVPGEGRRGVSVPTIRPDAPLIVAYVEALETIIRSLPGQVTINGELYSNEEGIAELRRRFDVGSLFAEEPASLAGIQALLDEAQA